MRSLLFTTLITLTFAGSVHAATIEGVDFPDEITQGTTKLVLNGVGLRTKRKLGMNFRVYVAALYAAKKSTEAQPLIDSPETKVLELSFLRSIDKDTLQEAWKEGFEKNCKTDCEKAKAQLNEFNALMTDVKDKSRIKVTFEKDTVSVDVTGKITSSGKVTGEAFRKAMLAVFIGDQPATEDLKKGLLGK